MQLSRRDVLGLFAASAALAAEEWIPLFNGTDLTGWKANESKESWKVRDGVLWADGPRSHLFYTVREFKNFELEAEVLAQPECNSGIYFHTAYQETGFPIKGFEIQVNNTAKGEGTYRERKKTGSLYGVRNVYKQLVEDNRWFKLAVSVRGKTVQISVDGALVVDYTEPTPPVIPPGPETGRFLDRGQIALQCHNQGSIARFRSLRIRPLPDDLPTPGTAPVVDDTYRQLLTLGRNNYPVVDYHVHLKGTLTLEQALARSRRDGIGYGLAVNCGKGFPIESDEGALKFFEGMKGQPVFIAMQAEGREWMQMFTRKSVTLFDYVFTDSMTWTDNHGKRMRTWLPNEVGTITDAQEFMDTLVDRAVGILEHEPIDIYVNPTFVPDQLQKDYDRLWTDERMKRVAEAAAKNKVAVELNDRYKLPSAAFVKVFKAAGCKFTFGTNNAAADDLRRSEYGLRMVEECRLGWQDFFVPGAWWPRAVDRRGELLKA